MYSICISGVHLFWGSEMQEGFSSISAQWGNNFLDFGLRSNHWGGGRPTTWKRGGLQMWVCVCVTVHGG